METKEKEIWRDIPNYDGYYQASNLGRVRSLDRWVTYSNGRERFFRGRILEGGINKTTGYRQVRLTVNSEGKTFTTSQLVAITYLDHKPDGFNKVIDHVNGDITDDRLSNLRIVSHRENISTCFRKDRQTLISKYAGVSWHRNNSKWQASIRYKGVLIHLGYFNDELKASKSYQKALAKIEDGTFNVNDYKPNFTSKYKGVYFQKVSNKWVSQTTINGKQKYLGLFNTELEAFNCVQKFKRNIAIHKFKINNGLYKHLSVA